MPKGDTVYLGHMLDSARSAIDKLSGKSRAEFDADETLRLALVHLIQIIGEAARRVSEPTRLAHPEVPWHQIIGMRHRVVHDYFSVDYDIVWRVVTHDLPPLAQALAPHVPDE
jgi:uncharacterized protein with HEPN domain